MTRFEFLKRLNDEEIFVALFLGVVKKYKTEKEICTLLKKEFSEEHMKIITNACKNGYPLSLDGMQ